jgi:predicted dehydrogenase
VLPARTIVKTVRRRLIIFRFGGTLPLERPIGVAVVGAGYWGPNLIRNLQQNHDVELRWVCDLDEARLRTVLGRYSTVRATQSLDDLLADPAVDAVVVATPAATHERLGSAVLTAGKHLLMEKPLASTSQGGRRLVSLAEAGDLVLMCDHTYCYTPAVQRIKEMIADDLLGEITTSTRSGSTWAWCSVTSTSCGTSRRTIWRSSTTCCLLTCVRSPCRLKERIRSRSDASAWPT